MALKQITGFKLNVKSYQKTHNRINHCEFNVLPLINARIEPDILVFSTIKGKNTELKEKNLLFYSSVQVASFSVNIQYT